MIVVGLVTAADVAAGDDVGVAGAVDVGDAGAVGGADAGIELDFEFGIDVEATMFGIEVVDESQEGVGEETVDIANEIVAIEHAGREVLDIVVAVAVAEVVGIDASERYIADADIAVESEDYVEVALEKRW